METRKLTIKLLKVIVSSVIILLAIIGAFFLFLVFTPIETTPSYRHLIHKQIVYPTKTADTLQLKE